MAYEPAPLPSLSLVGGFSPLAISYSMTAVAGSYSLSGQAVGGFKSRKMAAAQGTYALVGQDAYADFHVVAVQGSYALTGNAVGLSKSQRSIAAEPGTYSMTGQNVNLLYIERVLTLLPEAGSYTLNTFAVNLIAPAVLTGNKVKQRTQVWAGSAVEAGNMTVSTAAVIGTSTPDVFFLKGTSGTEDISDYATGTGNLVYTVATGALGSGVTLGTDGVLNYNGTGGPGVHRIAINAENVVTGSRFEFAEIPELVFVEGIAETEELGPYQLDPNNPWTPGDLTNASGWQAAQTCQLLSNGALVSDAWLSYNAGTGRLTYSGASISGASRDYVCTLRNGSRDSDTFRIRILRPNYVYGYGAAPGDEIAAHGWTGAAAIDAGIVAWSQPNSSGQQNGGPVRRGSQGASDSTPRVVFLTGEDFPHSVGGASQNWACSLSNKVGNNITSWLYVLGDPRRRPYLFKASGTHGRFQMRSESVIWYLKNLDLENIGIYETSLTSNRKKKTFLHKIRQRNTNGGGTGFDAIGSSFDYAPFPFPSSDRVDATDGSLGTYFHTYLTFVEGIHNGNQGGVQHQMYAEGNGTSATFINASLFAGARSCSTLKTIQSMLKVRNTLGSVAPDYDTFASSSDSTVHWAQELLDVKASTLLVNYNNDWRVGRVGASGKGARRFIFRRKRRTAYGGDVPPYPDDNWNPPLGSAGHTPIPNFSGGPETFADDAYWAAVAATDILSPSNPYSLKHYHSHCTVRNMFGTVGSVLRDDGTHPTEETRQFLHSTILGTHEDWIERNVSFMSNMTYVGYPSGPTYELDDSDAIDITEDGTGNAQRSYFVTWTDGTQGYVRVNNFINEVKSWTASLNAKMTALGGSPTNGVSWTTVQANLISQVAQPLYPPAKFQIGTPAQRPELYPKVVEVTDLPSWFLI